MFVTARLPRFRSSWRESPDLISSRSLAAEAVVVAVVLAVLSAVPLRLLSSPNSGGSAAGTALLATSVAILVMGALCMVIRAVAAVRSARALQWSHKRSTFLLAKAYADRDAVILAAADLRGITQVLGDEASVARERPALTNDTLRLTHQIQLDLESLLRELASERETLYREGEHNCAGLLDAERAGRRALLEADMTLTRLGWPLPMARGTEHQATPVKFRRYEVDE